MNSVVDGLVDKDKWDCNIDVSDTIDEDDEVTIVSRYTEEDVEKFAEVTGDTNRLHLDKSYAQQTMFEERIVHGMLVSSLISAALARFPGKVILSEQELNYMSPVKLGKEVKAICVVKDKVDDILHVDTSVESNDTVLIDGNAEIVIR
jgi:acyl dehydratase